MPTMTQHSPTALHHPGEGPARPKGILKNSSFSGPSGPPNISPPKAEVSLSVPPTVPDPAVSDNLDQKELTLQNTLQNAGRRRSSSAARRASASRRHSSTSNHGLTGMSEQDENQMRLKWDEVNLYLQEQDRTPKMKITEPKTPFAHGYDPDVEEAELDEDPTIDPQDLAVDEYDLAKKKKGGPSRESDIPGLDIGEPEEAVNEPEFEDDDRLVREKSLSREGSTSSGRHVVVGEDDIDERGGQETQDTIKKHKEFEERRKKHYEMKDIKGLLGHPEDLDEMDEDEDDDGANEATPPMPSLPSRDVNGGR